MAMLTPTSGLFGAVNNPRGQGATTQTQATAAPTDTPSAQNSNPLQPNYINNVATGQAATTDVNTSPQQTLAMIMQGFAPQAAQSTAALNNTLAAMGIVGGGAQDAQTLLQTNLAAALAGQLAPAVENSQGLSLQQAMGNAQGANSMTALNTGALNNANQYNATSANSAGLNLAQLMMQAYLGELGAVSGTNQEGLVGANQLASNESNNFSYTPGTNYLNDAASLAALFAGG